MSFKFFKVSKEYPTMVNIPAWIKGGRVLNTPSSFRIVMEYRYFGEKSNPQPMDWIILKTWLVLDHIVIYTNGKKRQCAS